MSSDVHTRDFAHLACPGEAQNRYPDTPFWGTPAGPLPQEYILSSDVHTRDFGLFALPDLDPFLAPRVVVLDPILGLPMDRLKGQNHVYGRLSTTCYYGVLAQNRYPKMGSQMGYLDPG